MQSDHPHGAIVSTQKSDHGPRHSQERVESVSGVPKRLAIYTHDTYGMGHVRRCFNIIDALCAEHKDWPILLISGSPALSKFDHRPSNVDIIKLPTLAPTGELENQPAHLPLSAKEIVSIRKKILKATLQAFEPDIFLVDNFPLGARKELLPSLKMLGERTTHKVLGLRDIVEDPKKTKERWAKEGVYDVLSNDYDSILIYGHQEIFDAGEAYAMPDQVRDKLTYCGYVTRAPSAFQKSVPVRGEADCKSSVGARKRHLLVTVGGGGDGLPLLNTFFQTAEVLSDFETTVVAGPMMGEGDWKKVQQRAASAENITAVKFLPDLVTHMGQADVVVCMGGYNTSAELIRLQRRAIIVPRDWRFGQHAIGVGAGEEKEQKLRAEAMARNGYARVISPSDLTPESLAVAIREESAAKPGEMVPLSADGAKTVANLISDPSLAKAGA